MNDELSPAALGVLLAGAFGNAARSLRPGAAYYVTGPQGGPLLLAFMQAIEGSGLRLRHMLVWVKQSLVMGRADYHYQHEPIIAGTAPGDDLEADPVAYGWAEGTHEFHGGRKQSSVWQIPRPARSPLHPTQKPVELVERAIRNSTRVGALVLDLFAGSGTTLIAAHRVDRAARLLELDPVNVDVICRRWQDYSGGLLPVRMDTGEEVSFGSNEDAGRGHARGAVGHQRADAPQGTGTDRARRPTRGKSSSAEEEPAGSRVGHNGRRPRARDARLAPANPAPARSRR